MYVKLHEHAKVKENRNLSSIEVYIMRDAHRLESQSYARIIAVDHVYHERPALGRSSFDHKSLAHLGNINLNGDGACKATKRTQAFLRHRGMDIRDIPIRVYHVIPTERKERPIMLD